MSKKDNYVCFFSMLSFPFFTFPPFFFYLILIVCVYMLTILVSKASKMLNKNGQSEHPCLVIVGSKLAPKMAVLEIMS